MKFDNNIQFGAVYEYLLSKAFYKISKRSCDVRLCILYVVFGVPHGLNVEPLLFPIVRDGIARYFYNSHAMYKSRNLFPISQIKQIIIKTQRNKQDLKFFCETFTTLLVQYNKY